MASPARRALGPTQRLRRALEIGNVSVPCEIAQQDPNIVSRLLYANVAEDSGQRCDLNVLCKYIRANVNGLLFTNSLNFEGLRPLVSANDMATQSSQPASVSMMIDRFSILRIQKIPLNGNTAGHGKYKTGIRHELPIANAPPSPRATRTPSV